MQINQCLILAAGFGTRMGKIGQKLPKVLWPVFEKSLLELQVAYARSLGISKIFINLHHMGEEIEAHCKDKQAFEGVQFLWEKPEILDIGGAVHNLASLPEVKYRGKLLILNADQFFYVPKDDLFKFLKPHEKAPSVLFTYRVNSSQGYNALQLDDKRSVKGIIKNAELPRGLEIETYTGISVVDLSQLRPVPGPSPFFKSVCPFDTVNVASVLLDKVDYWDFGTMERYWETSFRILSTYRVNSTHPFLRFLVQERALKTWKINLQNLSYHAKSPQIINLAPDQLDADCGPSIVLRPSSKMSKGRPMIWWGDLSEEPKI